MMYLRRQRSRAAPSLPPLQVCPTSGGIRKRMMGDNNELKERTATEGWVEGWMDEINESTQR